MSWRDMVAGAASQVAQMAVYNPEPLEELKLTLDAASLRRTRTCACDSGDRLLAVWKIAPGGPQFLASPSFPTC